MTYEIRYNQIDIPELDSFLEEYGALCKKYGIEFSAEEYGSGGVYMTIRKYGSGSKYLNLDEADGEITFIKKARDEAERRNELRYAADREAAEDAEKARQAANEKLALEEGVVLGGKKYKLVPDQH